MKRLILLSLLASTTSMAVHASNHDRELPQGFQRLDRRHDHAAPTTRAAEDRGVAEAIRQSQAEQSAKDAEYARALATEWRIVDEAAAREARMDRPDLRTYGYGGYAGSQSRSAPAAPSRARRAIGFAPEDQSWTPEAMDSVSSRGYGYGAEPVAREADMDGSARSGYDYGSADDLRQPDIALRRVGFANVADRGRPLYIRDWPNGQILEITQEGQLETICDIKARLSAAIGVHVEDLQLFGETRTYLEDRDQFGLPKTMAMALRELEDGELMDPSSINLTVVTREELLRKEIQDAEAQVEGLKASFRRRYEGSPR